MAFIRKTLVISLLIFLLAGKQSSGTNIDTLFTTVNTGVALTSVNRLLDTLPPSVDTCGFTLLFQSHGSIIFVGDSMAYHPDPGFTGIDSVGFNICLTTSINSGNFNFNFLILVQDSCSPADCVYPGDANQDGIVDNHDVVYLGWGYGHNGPSRLVPNNIWTPQHAPDWNAFSPDSTNNKHADCNGDGVIDQSDLNAIEANYSDLDAKQGFGKASAGAPKFYVAVFPDTVQEGDTVRLDLHIGTSQNPAVDMYGFASSFHYIHPYLVPSEDVSVSFANSWLTGNDYYLSMKRNFYQERQIDIALTRTDGIVKSGHGIVASIYFIIEDNLDEKDHRATTLEFTFDDAVVVNEENEELLLGTGSGSVVLFNDKVKAQHSDETYSQYKIYPNPAFNYLEFSNSGSSANAEFKIHQITGRTVLSGVLNLSESDVRRVDVSTLMPGSYLLVIEDEFNFFSKLIQIVR